ncbi:MAG TPA: carbonic anhydrase [Gemmatimonadales bacterium]|jgi:carbonic anhydrase|nr:carbonic anhydrase [Gemmatimonadales bacterium]
MSATDDLLRANAEYVRTFDRGDLQMPPARRLAIVTCMDARIDPARAFGLEEGDAHVIRNAGGRAREALRSLVISERLLGTNEIAVIHHTECGMLTFTNPDLHAKVKKDLGADASHIDFLPFRDLEESIREDVAFLLSSPLIPGDVVIRGFLYDVRTGRLNEVSFEPATGQKQR